MARKLIQGIYKITNIKNGKFYIGSSNDIKDRWREHICDLRQNKHHSEHLQRAWNKFGEENFKFEIIELVEKEEDLLKIEQSWIDKTKCYKRDIGYNVSRAAIGIKLYGEENGFYGKKHTLETRYRMSKNHCNVKGTNNPRYGEHCSDETKAKISNSFRKRIENGWSCPLKNRKRDKKTILKYSGENSGVTKISVGTARQIKMALYCDMDILECAKIFNVPYSTVKAMQKIDSWKYELEELNFYIKNRVKINRKQKYENGLKLYAQNIPKYKICKMCHLDKRKFDELIAKDS